MKSQKKQKTTSCSTIRTILRLKALIAYYKGNDTDSIAPCYDVSERSLKNWIKKFKSYGNNSMEDDPLDDRPVKLPEKEREKLKRMIEKDSQRVWVARHVSLVLVRIFGVVYTVKYIPELLKKLSLSFHKTIHFLVRRDSKKRMEWIKEKLPKIYEKRIKDGWRIFYQDEVGFQSEVTLAYT